MKTRLHRQAKIVLESKKIQYFILICIVINSIGVGLDTYPAISNKIGDWIFLSNQLCFIVFIFEFLLRLYVYRLGILKRKWDLFDLFVIVVSILPETSMFSVFRFLRIIRLLRVITLIPKMKLISEILMKSLGSIVSVILLLIIICYIYAVIITSLYGNDFPKWFGTIQESYYTLFQIMTFDSWSMGIARPVMEKHPYAWIIFISFIIIATYIVLNIVIGIIVDCISDIKDEKTYTKNEKSDQLVLVEKISSLEQEIKELKNDLPNIVIGIIVDCISDIKDEKAYTKNEKSDQLVLVEKISSLEQEIKELKNDLPPKS